MKEKAGDVMLVEETCYRQMGQQGKGIENKRKI